MKEINFDAIRNIESLCTELEQTGNAFWLIVEKLEGECSCAHSKRVTAARATAALYLYDRMDTYLSSIYLIFREITRIKDDLRAEVEDNLIIKKTAALDGSEG